MMVMVIQGGVIFLLALSVHKRLRRVVLGAHKRLGRVVFYNLVNVHHVWRDRFLRTLRRRAVIRLRKRMRGDRRKGGERSRPQGISTLSLFILELALPLVLDCLF